MTKIFLTGASGFIGGDVLFELNQRHPEYEVTALNRDANHGKEIIQAFPQVRIVSGSLDDVDLIEKEASQADVVLNLAATGHLKSVQAIHKAQAPYLVQISGATALAADEIAASKTGSYKFGSGSELVFDDVDGIASIRDVIRRNSASRAVDSYVLDQARPVHTALIFGPIIYGQGRGPVNQSSIQIPSLVKATIQRGKGVRVGEGLSSWGSVHVADVSSLIVNLVEKAAQGRAEDNGSLWSENGLYLAGFGETTFGQISEKVAEEATARGLIKDNSVEELEGAAADNVLPHGRILYGTNARGNARRGAELLGWKPSQGPLEQEIVRVVTAEATSTKGQ